MKSLTVDDLMALGPGKDYPRKRVVELWAGREALSLLEFCALAIPAQDIIWSLCQPGVLPPEVRQTAVTDTVARAVRDHALSHPAITEWAGRWLSGEDRSVASASAASVVAAATKAWAELALSVAAVRAVRAVESAEAAELSVELDASAAACASVRAQSRRTIAAAAEEEEAERKLQIEDFRRAIRAAEDDGGVGRTTAG